MNSNSTTNKFSKINIYLSSSTPSSREKELIKHIIQNYKSFNTQNTKIKLGKIFKGVNDSKEHETFFKRIKHLKKKDKLHIILSFGNISQKNGDIGFVDKLLFSNKQNPIILPYADMLKEIRKDEIEPFFIPKLSYIDNDFLKKLLKYFQSFHNIIYSCIYFPRDKITIENEKIYEIINKWILLFEKEFLIISNQKETNVNEIEVDPSGGW